MKALEYKLHCKADNSGIEQAKHALTGFKGVIEGLKASALPLMALTAAFGALKKVVDMAKDGVNGFAYQQEQLAKLSVSVANNNKLNAESLKRIIDLTGDLQKKSIYGDDELQKQAAYLANLGLTEEQIKRTLETAVNMASSGVASLDSAVKGIGQSYQGISKGLGTIIPEVKNLTDEQLKAGAAVDVIASKYNNMAQTIAQTVSGTKIQYQNLVGDVQEILGSVWAAAQQGFQRALIPVLEKINEWLDKNLDKVLEFAIKLPKLTAILADGIWQVLKRLFDPKVYIEFIKTVFETIWTVVIKAFETFANLIKAIATTIWEPLKAGFGLVIEFIVNTFGSAINKIIQGLNWVITQINKIPGVNIGTMKELGKLDLDTKINTSAIAESWKDVGNSFLNYLKGLGKGVDDLFGASPLGALKDSFEQMKDVLKEDVSALVEQLKNPKVATSAGTNEPLNNAIVPQASTLNLEASTLNLGILPDMNIGAILKDSFMPFINELMTALMSIGPVASLFAASKPIIEGIMNVLQPIVSSILQPFVNFLFIIGQTIGKLIAPMLIELSPIIELVMKALVFLYNYAIRPFANAMIWITTQINNAIAWVINSIIELINKIPGVNISWRMGYLNYNSLALQEISAQSLGASGGSANVSAGASASYTGAKTLNISINFNQSYVNGDARAIALMLRDEIRAAEALGY